MIYFNNLKLYILCSLYCSFFIIQSQQSLLEVKIDNHIAGFFSFFKGVIGYLYTYDEYISSKYSNIKINFLNPTQYTDYSKGPNWWEYYFETITEKDFITKDEYLVPQYYFMELSSKATTIELSRERAYKIITKYIKIKSPIQLKIDNFVNNYFKNNYIIGIHYRSTYKFFQEAATTPFSILSDEIKKIAKDLESPYYIFVATDNQNFLDYIKLEFNNVIHLNYFRSSDNQPIHFGSHLLKTTPYQLGEDALMDCILLSKCNIIIRTHSNLSSAASDFNPHIKVITVNKHSASDIWRDS